MRWSAGKFTSIVRLLKDYNMEILAFITALVTHLDLVQLVFNAIEKGVVQKEDLMDTIQKAMVAASDEAEKARLGLPLV